MDITQSQFIKKFSLGCQNIHGRNIFSIIILLLLGIFSAQRFLIPVVSAISCLFIFCLIIIFGFRKNSISTYLFLSLFAIVDLGGGVYNETPAFIKYLLYFSGVVFLFTRPKFQLNWLSVALLLFFSFAIVINTVAHPYGIDQYTFFRDLFTFYLIIVVFLAKRLHPAYSLNYSFLLAFSLGVLVSELINILLFYRLSSGEYLNYSSFKFIVLIPVFYWLSTRNYRLATLIIPLVFVVVSAFGSRMLLLTGLLVLFIFMIRDSKKSLSRILGLFAAFLLALSIFQYFFGINFELFRVLSVFGSLFELDDFYSVAEFLDPVRFAENSVFFNQNIHSLLLGNGLGAGILDKTGIFAFVPDDGGAFSAKELSDSHFFRFHDSWTWIGYRFGFLAYILFVFWGVKGCLNRHPEISFIASLMLLSLFNSTFSIGGLIVCASFALYYKCALQRHIAAQRPL